MTELWDKKVELVFKELYRDAEECRYKKLHEKLEKIVKRGEADE